MIKYLFTLLFSLFFLLSTPEPGKAEDCYLPTISEYEIAPVKKIKREVFRQSGYLIFIYYYDVADPMLRDHYAEFNYKNTIRLAEKNWEKLKNPDIDDYWDENGRTKPYLLIEFGGGVFNGYFRVKKLLTLVGTCYDRKQNNAKLIYYVESGEYQQIISGSENIFIPILAIEDREERKK